MSKRHDADRQGEARRAKALKLKNFRAKIADNKEKARAVYSLVGRMRLCRRPESDPTDRYVVADSAKWQISSLGEKELRLLASVVDGKAKASAMIKTTPTGNVVSRLGKNMRVLWRKEKNGKPTILSVVVKPEAAEA